MPLFHIPSILHDCRHTTPVHTVYWLHLHLSGWAFIVHMWALSAAEYTQLFPLLRIRIGPRRKRIEASGAWTSPTLS
jgi:hypothetical protein